MTKRMILLLTIASAALAGGCGLATNGDPTAGYTMASQYRTDVKTIAVPIWGRSKGEYRREIETRLTAALVKRIEAQTPYKVVDKSRADTELTGTVVEAAQTVMSHDPRTGMAREIQVRLVVDFAWRDLRPGRQPVILDRKGVSQAAEYIPTDPFGEDFFQGSEDAVDELAKRIVEQLAADW